MRQSNVLHYIDADDANDDDDNADVNSARRNAFSAIADELDDGDVMIDETILMITQPVAMLFLPLLTSLMVVT